MQKELKNKPLIEIADELREGMALAKCRKCGCMKDTLQAIGDAITGPLAGPGSELLPEIQRWRAGMEPVRYACLGCDYCFPAVAANIIHAAYPGLASPETPDCAFEIQESSWPPVPGEYKVLCKSSNCAVAITTLGDPALTDTIAAVHPKEVCIVGKTETENIGIDKLIKNTITNHTIRFLVLAGNDPGGHLPGHTLLSLSKNGVDDGMRVIGSKGKRPILRNVTRAEVEAFRKQVQIVDMIGCGEVNTIIEKVQELSVAKKSLCGCGQCDDDGNVTRMNPTPVIQAMPPEKIEMDTAGYFVILPQGEKGTITVEHYSYDDELLRTIGGNDARSLYWTIIQNYWVTQLSHSAYLGKELFRAELSIKHGFKFVQDGA